MFSVSGIEVELRDIGANEGCSCQRGVFEIRPKDELLPGLPGIPRPQALQQLLRQRDEGLPPGPGPEPGLLGQVRRLPDEALRPALRTLQRRDDHPPPGHLHLGRHHDLPRVRVQGHPGLATDSIIFCLLFVKTH